MWNANSYINITWPCGLIDTVCQVGMHCL